MAAAITSTNAISSTLRLDRLDPEPPAAGTAGRFTLVGAEWTTGRDGAGFAACTIGFAFFFAGGLAWWAFFAAVFGFGRCETLCFGATVVAGWEVDGVEDGVEDDAGAGVTTGAGVETGAGAGVGLLCVLPLDVGFEVVC